MTLSVIGAGFGRTGTDSMREALNILGFGPCHHMHEVINNPEQRRLWSELANGATADWEKLFHGYRATVDWPSAHFWLELATAYPHAKILLTTRSSESWLKSIQNTIFRSVRENSDPRSIGRKIIMDKTFGGRLDDPDHVVAVYERHNTEVQKTIDPERLLVHQSTDGWNPLCQFLGVAIPDSPYPRRNSAEEFNAASQERKKKR